MKSNKGNYGYFQQEKKRRLLITLGLFAIPLAVFFGGLLYYGKRETVLTVISIVGCLPACRSMVNLIMVWMQKSLPEEEYRLIHEHAGNLTMAYEMYLTSQEKSSYVDAFAICGNEVVGYSRDPKIDVKYTSSQVQKILHQNGYRVNVKILKDLQPYLDRLESLQKNREALEKDIRFTPDERYPQLSRNELIKHTILAIAL